MAPSTLSLHSAPPAAPEVAQVVAFEGTASEPTDEAKMFPYFTWGCVVV